MAMAPPVSPSPSPSPSPSSEPSVFCLSFNQDHSCIASGTSSGFRIFNSDPLSELFRREFDSSAPSGGGRLSFVRRVGGGGAEAAVAGAAGATSAVRASSSSNGDGFTIVEMLFRSNVLALVSPRYSSNKVIVWDDYQGHCIGELLFRSEVRAVRLRRDRIVVVLEHKIHLYSFPDLRLVHQVETLANPRGLCTLSSASGSCIMACPGLNRGEVRVEIYGNKRTKFLQAHTSDLACISLCSNGALLATASTKGTLIRIFNAADGSTLQELRRGTDRADIYSLAFSSNSHWLAVSSDKGTIHVFCLNEPWSSCEDGKNADGFHMSSSGTNWFSSSLSSGLSSSISSGLKIARSSLMSLAHSNTSSSLSFMKGVLPKYFSSEWSFAQFRLPEDTHAIVVFGAQRNTVVVLCSNGSYYKCSFDLLRGGEMVLEETSRL